MLVYNNNNIKNVENKNYVQKSQMQTVDNIEIVNAFLEMLDTNQRKRVHGKTFSDSKEKDIKMK